MAFIIIAMLIFMSRFFFQNQIDFILKNLKDITQGEYKKISISNFYNSYETSQLVENINNMNNKLYFNLYHNTLTKLPNRNSLVNDIKSNNQTKTLFILDLDALKEINDFYGHETGDLVIQTIANRLVNIQTNSETLNLKENSFLKKIQKHSKTYHLGADEFAILITYKEKYQQSDIKNLAEIYSKKIQNHLIEVQNHTFPIRVSIGISTNKDNLFIQADMALQQAKENKKDIIFYNEDFGILKQYKENLKWIQKLEKAIREDRIVCVYQPIYNNKTKKIEKYETLVRIIEKDGSLITPFYFLEVAKKAKLYDHITRTVIKKSFEHFKDKPFSFSINISIEDIRNLATKKFILDSLEKFPEPHRVIFELLESEEIEKYDEVNSFIYELKKYGVKIAIDDFGTGYSNFSYILNLNVDILKIDGSLIKNLDTDADSRAVVHTIMNFCSHSNIKVVAEFVDRKELHDKVTEMGIHYTQGYYISEPKRETL